MHIVAQLLDRSIDLSLIVILRILKQRILSLAIHVSSAARAALVKEELSCGSWACRKET
jgi:hypothetical protein